MLLMSVVGVLLTSCEKDEMTIPKQGSAEVESVIPQRRLTLDMMDVHWVGRSASNVIVYTPSGYRYEFTESNERYTVLVQVDVDSSGNVSGMMGRYNGHSWIMWGGVVNVCNGQQGVAVSYQLR